jgi:signal transduction histidine kinase
MAGLERPLPLRLDMGRHMRNVLAVLTALALIVVLVGVLSAAILQEAIVGKDEVIAKRSEDLLHLENFIALNERAARKTRSYLLTGSPRFLAERQQTRAELERQLALLQERIDTPEERRLLARVASAMDVLGRETTTLLEQRAQGLPVAEAGKRMEHELQPDRDEVDALLAELKRREQHLLEHAKRAAERIVSRAFTLLAMAVGASILLSGALAYMLVRSWRRLLDAAAFQQRVIAIVGHDVRSPLAAIMASASHALKLPSLDERLTPLLRRVLRGARRIEVLTKLLMDFSQARLTPGLNLNIESGDMHALCEHVLDEARGTWPSRELVLEKVGDGRGDFDWERLEQALANLVDNALRHGMTGTRVTVVSRGTNPSVLEASVHNEGPPIDPALLPHIFEPFRHGKRLQEVVRESMGMGLYIVSEVVKAHGGRVAVESTQERGTRFVLRVPRMPLPRNEA